MSEQENILVEERIQKIREETERINRRAAKARKKSDRRYKKFLEERKAYWKQVDERHEKFLEESDRRHEKFLEESKERWKRIDEQFEKINTKMTDHGEQIGGHHNKFGSLTEALARPSIKRILRERFDASFKVSNIRIKTEFGGRTEIDRWSVALNGTGAVYLIEIKSRFRPKYLKQVWRHVELMRAYRPEYRDAEMYPILAVVEIKPHHRELVWREGIHLIDVSDGVFEWAEPPEGFVARGDHGANGGPRHPQRGGVGRAVPADLRLVK